MKKNGFTLVELMITVTLIILISIIVVPKVKNAIDNSKQKSYDALVITIEDAARSYTYLNSSSIDGLITANGHADITILTLQQNSLLDTDLENPLTKVAIPTSYIIRITKTNNLYDCEYIGEGV